jgi:hypothetical protein
MGDEIEGILVCFVVEKAVMTPVRRRRERFGEERGERGG